MVTGQKKGPIRQELAQRASMAMLRRSGKLPSPKSAAHRACYGEHDTIDEILHGGAILHQAFLSGKPSTEPQNRNVARSWGILLCYASMPNRSFIASVIRGNSKVV